jgi:hypothetical protein
MPIKPTASHRGLSGILKGVGLACLLHIRNGSLGSIKGLSAQGILVKKSWLSFHARSVKG